MTTETITLKDGKEVGVDISFSLLDVSLDSGKYVWLVQMYDDYYPNPINTVMVCSSKETALEWVSENISFSPDNYYPYNLIGGEEYDGCNNLMIAKVPFEGGK